MATIGEAARRAGLSVKTTRYYADIDLVAPGGRNAAGYRIYDADDIGRLAFIRRARAFGFSIGDCRELLSLYADRKRPSAEVKRIAQAHLAALDAQRDELAALRDEMARLIDGCAGDSRPDCPILDALAR